MGISGGFLEADWVVSCAGHVFRSLRATHEEASDTRIILHAIMQYLRIFMVLCTGIND